MDLKHILYALLILVVTVITTTLTVTSHKARQVALFILVFGTAFMYKTQITFFGWVYYRGTARGYEISLMDVIAFSLIVAVIVRPKRGQGGIFWPASLGPMLLYLAYCTGRTLCADPMILSWWEVFKVLRGIIVVIAVAWYVRTEKEMNVLVLAMACVVCYEGLHALDERYHHGVYRSQGTLMHENTLSMYMCMCAPVLYAAALSKLPALTRNVSTAGCGLTLVGVILSISRSGNATWLLIMLAITLACVSLKLTIKKVVIAFLAVALVGTAIGYSWKTLRQRIMENSTEDEMSKDKLGRGSYVRLAKLMVGEHFWGVGMNNWSWYVTNEYQRKDNPKPDLQYKPYFKRDLDTFPVLDMVPVTGNETAQAAPAHNLSALTVGELGWPGLVLFLLVWARWFDMGQRFLWKRSPEIMHRLATGMFFGIGAAFLQSLTEWEFRQQPIFYLIHIQVGALAAMYRVRKKRKPLLAPQPAPAPPLEEVVPAYP